jgi:hypothetical protein
MWFKAGRTNLWNLRLHSYTAKRKNEKPGNGCYKSQHDIEKGLQIRLQIEGPFEEGEVGSGDGGVLRKFYFLI